MQEWVLVGGALAVGFAVGLSGFADALVASAVWLHVLPPLDTAVMIYLSGLFVHGWSLLHLRHSLDWGRLAPFLLTGATGTPIGLWLTGHADPTVMRPVLGGFLIFFSVWGLWRLLGARLPERSPDLPDKARGARLVDAGVGGLGGVLGGLGGLSGVLPALRCAHRGWSPAEQRAVYQPFIFLMHALALGLILFQAERLPDGSGVRFLIVLPALVAGMGAGLTFYGKLPERAFRLTLLGLVLVSGLTLIA